MTESQTVHYEITPEAVTDAAWLHQATFLAGYRVVTILIAIAGAVVALVVDPGLGWPIAITGVLLFAMTWMKFPDRWLVRARARGVVGGTAEIRLDDLGVHYVNPLGSGAIRWSALTRLKVNDHTIVFARDRVIAAYVPTSAFSSVTERESFVAFARARVREAEGARPV